MKKPLEGIKMLDLTRVLAGPYCSMILSDLGVETVKIEIPGQGDDARSFPPFNDGESAYFANLNRNKRSMTLNLKTEKGKEIFLALVEKADIVLENFRPGVMDKLGLGYKDLSKTNPGLIYAVCSGYGYTGPYKERAAYDLIVQAMGGIMSITGPDEDHMSRVGSSVADIAAGLFTVIGILAALNQKNFTEEGQFIDVAMLDCMVAILENAISRYFITGENPVPIGNRHPSVSPFGEFVARDGSMIIAAGNDTLFKKLCIVLERMDITEDKKYLTNELRVINWLKLTEDINNTLKSENVNEWITLLNNAGVPCCKINGIGDMVKNPQIISREMIVDVAAPGGRIWKLVSTPIRFSGASVEIERTAPRLGEHNREILKQYLGYTDKEIDELEGTII